MSGALIRNCPIIALLAADVFRLRPFVYVYSQLLSTYSILSRFNCWYVNTKIEVMWGGVEVE